MKQREQFGSTLVGKPGGCEAYIDQVNEHGRYRFMTMEVEDKSEWFVTVPETERRWVGLGQCVARRSVVAQSPAAPTPEEQPTAARQKSSALYKIIGQRMDKLARFINEEDVEAERLPVTGSIDDGPSGNHGK